MTVNPIVDWSDNDVWDYTHSEHLPVNPLYCEGQNVLAALAVLWPVGGQASASLCAGLPTK